MKERKIDKESLLRYCEYLKEKLDPWKLKNGVKSFNRQPDSVLTIPGDLKDLSKKLTSELSDVQLPYSKLLNFGGIELDMKIIQSNRYYSNVNWFDFLNGNNEIIIEVVPNYDVNYLVSTIIHEIRHMIDFTDENLNFGLSSFNVDFNLRKYKINNFEEFITLVYISLEHELVARNNQIYPYIKFKNLTKEESLKILKTSFIWKALEMLTEFDYISFINKFKENELIGITNNFIKDCLYDNENTIDDKNELILFYKTYDEFFMETAEKWKSVLLKEMDMVYERKVSTYYEYISYTNIINSIWMEIRERMYLDNKLDNYLTE